jgi:hypothetical protein
MTENTEEKMGVTDNRSILEKADTVVNDLTTGGGLLQPAQAAKFIRLLINESVLLKHAFVKPMKAQKELIEKIRFGSRILRPATEGVALPVADRSKPDFTQVELDVKGFKAEVRISEEALEDNIEKGQLKQTLMTLISEATARDMEEVIVNGDTGHATDAFLQQMDGILKQATSNTVDALDSNLAKSILRDVRKTMPSEYLRLKNKMKFFTSVDGEADWADSVSDRATILGDIHIEKDVTVPYRGMGVIAVPLFPEDVGTGSHCTNVILTDPSNICVGIWRQVRIRSDLDISAGVLRCVVDLRFDVKYQEETAVVKANNVKVI